MGHIERVESEPTALEVEARAVVIAPPRLYPPPIYQLGTLLRAARRRGCSFDQAWDEALRPGKSIVMTNARSAPDTALRWPTDKTEREAWRQALISSRLAWCRAYEQMPITRQERALLVLSDELGAMARGMSAELAVA